MTMTMQQVKQLTNRQRSVRIATRMGWKKHRSAWWHDEYGDRLEGDIPHYGSDLNAIQEAEQTIIANDEVKRFRWCEIANYLLGLNYKDFDPGKVGFTFASLTAVERSQILILVLSSRTFCVKQ